MPPRDRQDAIPLARRAVDLEGGSLEARLNLARMYLATGNAPAATAQVRVAQQLDPANAAAKDLAAELDRVTGRQAP